MVQDHPATILLVDDFEAWRCQLTSILQGRSGWKIVAEASDGSEAVAKAMDLQPDIILLDIALPVLDGIKAAKVIREKCPKSRIIFVTLNCGSEFREAAIRLGAAGYVNKMNAARDLLGAIAKALDGHQSEHLSVKPL